MNPFPTTFIYFCSNLKLAVESNATLVLVGGGERREVEVLGEVGSRGDGTTLLRLQRGHLHHHHEKEEEEARVRIN